VALQACSSDDNDTPAGTTDAGSDVVEKKEAAAAPDTGPEKDSAIEPEPDSIPIKCTGPEYAANDVSGVDAGTNDASVFDIAITINGPTGADAVQFSPNCVTVKVNQRVNFHGNWSLHPLQLQGKGDSGVSTTSGGNDVTEAYPTPGEYGFQCRSHPTIMFGAVKVVP